MSNNVKSFSVGYNPINKSNTFTSGDCITGQVTLELAKDCKIDSICVKLKGKVEVKWIEMYGKTIIVHYNKQKYFSIQQFVLQEPTGYIVGCGCHTYPFTFQIPEQDLPSSFKGSKGKVVYTLEANLCFSKKVAKKAKEKFTLCNRSLNSDPSMMHPQRRAANKKIKVFSSGKVGMDVNIARTGFHQETKRRELCATTIGGEGIQVVASIQNESSREIKLKYCLYEKHSYFADGKRKVETKDVLKEVGDTIPPSTSQTVTKTVAIPPTTCVSISNCDIIKVEHRLKVYLDVKYASDPEVKFPIAILPALPGLEGGENLSSPTYGFGAFANTYMPGETSFLQNPAASGPSAPPPSYRASGMYPSVSNYDGKF